MLIAAVPFALGIVSSSLAAVFQVRLQLGRAALADAVGRVASFAALLAVVAADLGFAAVVASATAVGAAVTLALTTALRAPARARCGWRPTARSGASWRVPALPLGLTLAVAEIYFRADTFILVALAPGGRGRPLRARLPALRAARAVPGARDGVGLPAAVAPARRRPRRRRAHAARDGARLLRRSGAPLAAGGLVVAPELARLAGGDEFAAAADPLRLLLCAAALAYVSGLLGYALIARGHAAQRAAGCRSRRCAFNVALNVALAPAYGATAAAAVALASEALLLAGGWLLLRRRLGLRPAAPGLVAGCSPPRVMVAAVWPLRDRTLALTVPLGARRLRRWRCGRSAASTAATWRRCAR